MLVNLWPWHDIRDLAHACILSNVDDSPPSNVRENTLLHGWNTDGVRRPVAYWFGGARRYWTDYRVLDVMWGPTGEIGNGILYYDSPQTSWMNEQTINHRFCNKRSPYYVTVLSHFPDSSGEFSRLSLAGQLIHLDRHYRQSLPRRSRFRVYKSPLLWSLRGYKDNRVINET